MTEVERLKATTLLDYEAGGVPDPQQFFQANRRLDPADYRRRLAEAYGPAATRSTGVKAMVNEAVMLYLLDDR